MFLIVACFQSSNNIAIAAALDAFGLKTGIGDSIRMLLLINAAIIVFLYAGRNLYRVIETVMKCLILMMVIAFLLNCIITKPSIPDLLAGLIPTIPDGDRWLLVGLIATTFSVAAAFYQAYLVREKNWTEADRQSGMLDSVIGIATLGGITLVIMMTSAAMFYGNEQVPKLKSAADVALQLKPLFGVWAQVIFGIGIFAGAISSFLVNALIGGHILADGLGLGNKIESKWTQHFTTAALLCGMIVAILSFSTGMSHVTLIVFAQALTVVGVPVLALTLIYLGIVKRRENKASIPIWVLLAATIGFLTTGLLAARTVISIFKQFNQ